jgi:hypothetical protein
MQKKHSKHQRKLPVAINRNNDTEMTPIAPFKEDIFSEVTLPPQSQIKPEEKPQSIVVSKPILSKEPLFSSRQSGARYDDSEVLERRGKIYDKSIYV